MTIGVLHEDDDESRVSLLPAAVAALQKAGHTIWVESGAGLRAYATDAEYEATGARVGNHADVLEAATALLRMGGPVQLRPDQVAIGVYAPLNAPGWLAQTAGTVFSLDMLPRTSRAQSMDVLSSQANIAGYKAVLLAASMYPRYFPMFMTAAGSIAPAKVLVLGAGVAGLQAVATARRLGAVVEVFDTRAAVKEEVQSLGAKFVEVEGAADASAAGGYAVEQSETYKAAQAARIAESLAKADVVITTAAIPGAKAPILISEAALSAMKPGSVIVDLAAGFGGNTPFTQAATTVVRNGVQIVGASRLPGTMPADASKLYGKNISNFLALLTNKEGNLLFNDGDDLVQGACIVRDGQLVHPRVTPLYTNAHT